ncbi:response regulator transcription factor [Zunongwangia endophytica]|uniref:Response regulator transcription factor n=1 Tax=Zunongwangia endophytica TaxID=1808945 RepID=A0ABV8H6W2_9FLAO|nr:response regulator transcription factor [Zunongwangia endophytica]MDN3593949.1 response regulator transcription factor [Zunongwangia endophytica]
MKIFKILQFIILAIVLLTMKGYSKGLDDSEPFVQKEEKKALEDTIRNFEESILDGKTKRESKVWGSNAEKAWLDYRLFESSLREDYDAKNYLEQTKSYLKDSTQILIVKLKGLESLNEKGLLEKDILQNQEYYLALLVEFENSELPPQTYLYFENKIRKVSLNKTNEKYKTSLILNFVGLIAIGGLTFGYFKNKKEKPSYTLLSSQEKKIKNLILDGKTNKEIAEALFISLSTVKTHISNIYSKLGVKNRKELQTNS